MDNLLKLMLWRAPCCMERWHSRTVKGQVEMDLALDAAAPRWGSLSGLRRSQEGEATSDWGGEVAGNEGLAARTYPQPDCRCLRRLLMVGRERGGGGRGETQAGTRANDRKDEAGMNELTVRSGDVKRKWVFVFPNGQNIGASQWMGWRSETGGKGAVESKWVVVCSTHCC